jgi:ABC-type phosphate transport system substrate-binding protein
VRGSIKARLNRVGWSGATLALCLAIGDAASADVVAVVSLRNSLTSLSKAQLTDIFLGKTTRFPDGTQAMPIDQEEGSPARDEFYATVAGKSAAQIKAYWAKIIFTGRGQPPKAVSNSIDIRKLLASNPQAIGYIERSSVDSSVKVLAVP